MAYNDESAILMSNNIGMYIVKAMLLGIGFCLFLNVLTAIGYWYDDRKKKMEEYVCC
jgi:hypothetical protein